jgi:hypothetical protein
MEAGHGFGEVMVDEVDGGWVMSVLFGVSEALIMIINTSFSGMNCYKKHLTSSLYRTAGLTVVWRLVASLYYTMLYLVGFTSLDTCTVR